VRASLPLTLPRLHHALPASLLLTFGDANYPGPSISWRWPGGPGWAGRSWQSGVVSCGGLYTTATHIVKGKNEAADRGDRTNPKPEARKPEGNPKPEIRNSRADAARSAGWSPRALELRGNDVFRDDDLGEQLRQDVKRADQDDAPGYSTRGFRGMRGSSAQPPERSSKRLDLFCGPTPLAGPISAAIGNGPLRSQER